ncbi:MAG: alpha/beta fold hydrolase [Longimicrobiales bacterium]|nr:alpha/beta fold hydrolase [Longimicrobiales bacterium]
MARTGSRSGRGAPAAALRAAIRAVLAALGVPALLAAGSPSAGGAQEAGAAQAFGDDRVPVLLVPGWMANDQTMGPLRELFLGAGWPPHRVAALAFRNPVGSNRDHARELADAVEDLRRRTGAERVDLVAHSMGGLAARYFLQEGGAGQVRRVIFVATPHRGTLVASLAWGEGGEEMRPGSDFLMRLGQLRGVPPGVEALTLRTPVDFHVLPPASATLPGVPDVEICCPGHESILNHPEAFAAMRAFLLRGVEAVTGPGASP